MSQSEVCQHFESIRPSPRMTLPSCCSRRDVWMVFFSEDLREDLTGGYGPALLEPKQPPGWESRWVIRAAGRYIPRARTRPPPNRTICQDAPAISWIRDSTGSTLMGWGPCRRQSSAPRVSTVADLSQQGHVRPARPSWTRHAKEIPSPGDVGGARWRTLPTLWRCQVLAVCLTFTFHHLDATLVGALHQNRQGYR